MSEVVPISRQGQQAALLDRVMVVFGGKSGNMNSFDVIWTYNLENMLWSKYKAINSAVVDKQSEEHAAVVTIGSVIYKHGGKSLSSYNCSADLFTLSRRDNGAFIWIKITQSAAAGSIVPSARSGHVAWEYNGKLGIFAGDCQVDNAVHCFDPATNMWSQQQYRGEAPMHTTETFYTASRLKDDMWMIKREASFEASSNGNIGSLSNNPDVFKLDLQCMHWTKVTMSNCPVRPVLYTGLSGIGVTMNALNDHDLLVFNHSSLKSWILHTDSLMWEPRNNRGRRYQLCMVNTYTSVRTKEAILIFGGSACRDEEVQGVEWMNVLQPQTLLQCSYRAVYKHRQHTRQEWQELPLNLKDTLLDMERQNKALTRQ